MRTLPTWALAACAFSVQLFALAGDAETPSFEAAPDAELLARLEALPANTWMKLPPCKTTGDLAWLGKDQDYRRMGPRVRDYCNRAVWAPERKRALYCGAGHNIHPYNDVWEFDLAANTWICLYGADPSFSRRFQGPEEQDVAWVKAHAVLKDGVLRSPRGAPLRPAHTWWGVAYDTDRKRLVFWDAHKGILFTDRALIAKALGIDPKDELLKGSGSGPGEAYVFEFDPETRTWQDVLTKVPKAYESSELEYLGDRKTLWLQSGKTYTLNADRKGWTDGGKSPFGAGGVTAYDPDTHSVVAVTREQTWIYSTQTGAWKQGKALDGDGAIVPSSTFAYDSAAKRFVLYTHVAKKDEPKAAPRLWLYDVATDTWSDPAPQGERCAAGNVAGYYDAARNVTVIYSNAQTWVYRAKK